MHPDPAIREAANAALGRIAAWRAEAFSRSDLSRMLERIDDAALDVAQQGQVRLWRTNARVAGGHLDDAGRAELAALITRVTAARDAILEGFGDAPTMEIEEGLLADLPRTWWRPSDSARRRRRGRCPLPTAVRDEIMRGVSDRAARERFWRLLQDRGRGDNTEPMAELFRVRRSIAHLAGFASWASLRTSVMAFGSPEAARDALDDLAAAAHPVTRDYIAACEAALGDEIDGGYQLWDQFRGQAMLARGVGVDEAAFRRYLPMDRVVAGLFDLTREVFGIRVEERHERLGWHHDVRTLALFDDATGEQIGVCLWDPFERDGKMAGAIAFMEMLEADVPGVDGRRPPVVSMLVTTFPEAGDGTHNGSHSTRSTRCSTNSATCSTTRRCAARRLARRELVGDRLRGGTVVLLRGLGAHACRPRAVCGRSGDGGGDPEDAVAMLRVGQAIEDISFLERYIALGRLDLAVHGPVEVDLDEAWRTAWAENPIPEPSGGFRPFPFSMVAGGYDAAVYGIPYALAVRDELLGAFESAGWLDPVVGRAYVERLLGPGPSYRRSPGWSHSSGARRTAARSCATSSPASPSRRQPPCHEPSRCG